MPDTPRWRFWWFNDDRAPDDTRHHLVDHWAWYAAVAGFPRSATVVWMVSYGLIALAPLVVGVAIGWRVLPAWVLRRRTGQRQGPKGRKPPRSPRSRQGRQERGR
jgi:hypothetical protein